MPRLPPGASREEGSPRHRDQEGIPELGSTTALSGCMRLVMGSFTPLCSKCVREPLAKGHDSEATPHLQGPSALVPFCKSLQIPAKWVQSRPPGTEEG